MRRFLLTLCIVFLAFSVWQTVTLRFDVDRLAASVERLNLILGRIVQESGPFMPAVTWTSGGSSHTFPAMSPNVGETDTHFRERYVAALDADMKAHPVDH